MKPLLTLLALVFAGAFGLSAQSAAPKTAKSPRRAWENAPAEERALWEQHKAALQLFDISLETQRHVVAI